MSRIRSSLNKCAAVGRTSRSAADVHVGRLPGVRESRTWRSGADVDVRPTWIYAANLQLGTLELFHSFYEPWPVRTTHSQHRAANEKSGPLRKEGVAALFRRAAAPRMRMPIPRHLWRSHSQHRAANEKSGPLRKEGVAALCHSRLCARGGVQGAGSARRPPAVYDQGVTGDQRGRR